MAEEGKRDYKAEWARRKAREAAKKAAQPLSPRGKPLSEAQAKRFATLAYNRKRGLKGRRGEGVKAKLPKRTPSGGIKWTAERKAKFQATMALKRERREARATRRAEKLEFLNGPPANLNRRGDRRGMATRGGQQREVTVLEPNGNLATYILTQVWAYVRQP